MLHRICIRIDIGIGIVCNRFVCSVSRTSGGGLVLRVCFHGLFQPLLGLVVIAVLAGDGRERTVGGDEGATRGRWTLHLRLRLRVLLLRGGQLA